MDARRIHAWYERWNLVLYLLFLGGCATLPYFAFHLRSENAIEKWLGDDTPAVVEYQSFRERFGVNDFVLMAFDQCPADDPRLTRLAEQVDPMPVVSWCCTPERVADMQGALAGVELSELTNLWLPLVGRHPQFSAIFIALNVSPDLDREKLLSELAHDAGEAGFEEDQIHWGGPPVINVALDHLATESLSVLFPLACVVMFLLLWYLLGRFSLALMVLLCSGVSVLATLSAMAYVGATMNMLLVALPPMILVLNLSFGVHLIHQWQQSPDRNGAVGFAIARSIKPATLAALTTAIGTASLATSRFEPVRSFGIWAAVGTVLALGISYLYIPLMLVTEPTPEKRPTLKFPGVSKPAVPVVLIAWIVVLVASASGLVLLRDESDALKFFPSDSRTLADYRRIEQRLTGLLAIEAIIDMPESLSWPQRVWLARRIESRLKNHPAVESTIGLASLLRDDPIRAGEQASALLEDEEYGPLVRNMITDDGQHWRVTASVASSESTNLSSIVEQLRRRIPSNVQVGFTGLVPLILAAQEEIFRGLLISFLVALVLLIIVLTVAFRSFNAAIVTLLPNVTPVVIVFGVYGWLARPLNVGALLTASTALGIALDDTLHLIAHFRHQSRHSPGATNAQLAQESIEGCGAPMVKTTVIATLGLGLLVFSRFGPSAQFGGLLALLLGVALACDLLIMPAILSTPLGNCFRAAHAPDDKREDRLPHSMRPLVSNTHVKLEGEYDDVFARGTPMSS